jgi:hypothetical protein
MATTKTEHYRVITPASFSNIDTVNVNGKFDHGSMKLIETIDEAKLAIEHFGDTRHLEFSDYWKEQAAACRVVKIITIIEEVEI